MSSPFARAVAGSPAWPRVFIITERHVGKLAHTVRKEAAAAVRSTEEPWELLPAVFATRWRALGFLFIPLVSGVFELPPHARDAARFVAHPGPERFPALVLYAPPTQRKRLFNVHRRVLDKRVRLSLDQIFTALAHELGAAINTPSEIEEDTWDPAEAPAHT